MNSVNLVNSTLITSAHFYLQSFVCALPLLLLLVKFLQLLPQFRRFFSLPSPFMLFLLFVLPEHFLCVFLVILILFVDLLLFFLQIIRHFLVTPFQLPPELLPSLLIDAFLFPVQKLLVFSLSNGEIDVICLFWVMIDLHFAFDLTTTDLEMCLGRGMRWSRAG